MLGISNSMKLENSIEDKKGILKFKGFSEAFVNALSPKAILDRWERITTAEENMIAVAEILGCTRTEVKGVVCLQYKGTNYFVGPVPEGELDYRFFNLPEIEGFDPEGKFAEAIEDYRQMFWPSEKVLLEIISKREAENLPILAEVKNPLVKKNAFEYARFLMDMPAYFDLKGQFQNDAKMIRQLIEYGDKKELMAAGIIDVEDDTDRSSDHEDFITWASTQDEETLILWGLSKKVNQILRMVNPALELMDSWKDPIIYTLQEMRDLIGGCKGMDYEAKTPLGVDELGKTTYKTEVKQIGPMSLLTRFQSFVDEGLIDQDCHQYICSANDWTYNKYLENRKEWAQN